MGAVLAAAVAGVLAGVFGTVLVLVAVDARRYGRRRRPALNAARLEVRGGLLRVTGAPSSSTAVARGERPS